MFGLTPITAAQERSYIRALRALGCTQTYISQVTLWHQPQVSGALRHWEQIPSDTDLETEVRAALEAAMDRIAGAQRAVDEAQAAWEREAASLKARIVERVQASQPPQIRKAV